MRIFLAVIIASLTFSLYWPAILSGLVSDDWGLSVPDSGVWRSFMGHWFGGGEGLYYRPLSRIFIYMQARMFGYSGFAQHLISVGLFLGSIAVVANLVQRYSGTAAAVVTSVVIATSPVAAPVVSWVASQTDLLVTLLIVLSISFLAIPVAQLKRNHITISLGFGFLAYLSKESAAILGPLAAVYLGLIIYTFGIRRISECRNGIIAAIFHMVLLFVYLQFRAWRLGKIGVGDIDPDNGWVWHVSQLYITALRDLFLPLSTLFPVNPARTLSGPSSVWPFGLTLSLIGILLYKKRYAASFAMAGFLVALIPHFSAAIETYPESGMVDVRRYLFVPLFFIGAAAGLLFSRKDVAPGAVTILILYAFFQGSLAQTRIHDYGESGAFRDRLIEEIQKKVTASDTQKPNFYVGRLPDKIGEAYSFRNGIREMLGVLYPGAKVYRNNEVAISNLPSGTVFFLDAQSEKKVEVTDMSKVKNSRTQSTRRAAPRFTLDFENRISDFNNISNNDVVQIEKTSPTLIVSVNGSDPMIHVPVPKVSPYNAYRQAFITLRFLDAETDSTDKEVMQYIWSLDVDAPDAQVPTTSKEVTLNQSRQTVVFDLQSNPLWFRAGNMKWHRIDFPESYRGRIEIFALGLK